MTSGGEQTQDAHPPRPEGQPSKLDAEQENGAGQECQAPASCQTPHQEGRTSGQKVDEKSTAEEENVTPRVDKGKDKAAKEEYQIQLHALARHAQARHAKALGLQAVFQIADDKPRHESENEGSCPHSDKGKSKAVETPGDFSLEDYDPDDLNLEDINIQNLNLGDLNLETIERVEVETVGTAKSSPVQQVENTFQGASSRSVPEVTKFRILETIQAFLTSMTTAPDAGARQHVIEAGFTFSSTPGEFQYYTLGQAILNAQVRKERGARPKFSDNEVRVLVRQKPEPEVFLRDRIAAVWCRVRQFKRTFHAMTSDAVCLFTLYRIGSPWRICSVVSSQLRFDRPTYKYAPELEEFLGTLSEIYANHTWDDLAQYHLKNAIAIEYSLAHPGAYPLKASYVRALAPKMKAWIKELDGDGRESRLEMQLGGLQTRICGEMGFVWAQVVFLLNSQVKCMSIDAMTFLKSGDRWLVTGVSSLGLD